MLEAGKTKFMWCQVNKGQIEDSGEHPYFFAEKLLIAIQSCAWSVRGGFMKENQENLV